MITINFKAITTKLRLLVLVLLLD